MTDAEKIVALATRRMGWTVVRFSDEDRRAGVYPRLVEQIDKTWYHIGDPEDVHQECFGWNPLKSIADAWMLVEKSGGMWVCPAENGHGWRAGILAKEDPSDEGGTYADTAPRAICEAFLKEIEATA